MKLFTKTLIIITLLIISANFVLGQSGLGDLSVRDDFDRAAQGDLSLSPPSFKWVKLAGQDDVSASLQLNSDSTISPVNSLGSGHFGGVAWDSLFTDTTQIGMVVKQKGGNGTNTSFFIFTRMSSKDLSTATGYCLRYVDMPSGTDQIMIQRIDPGVAQTTLASFNREVEPGDTLVMKVESDKTMKAFIYGINGIRDSISVFDNTYNPSEWYCWIDGCVFGTPVKMDDFMLGRTIPLINPEFAVLPTAIDFGTVDRGTNKIDSVIVTNSGLGVLSITSVVSTNPQFVVNPTSATISPSGSEKFYITYSPLVNGSQSSDIVFVYDAPSSPDTVVVTGVGSGFFVPSITSFTPASGPIGTTVTIAGTNFSTTPTNNIVYFGGVRALVEAATSNSLQVTVPTGTTYSPISITVDGLTANSDKPFIVTFIADHIIDDTSFAPKVDFLTPANPHFVVPADIDGDNKPDLVVVNGVANSLSILRNTSVSGSISGESFAAKVDFPAAAHTLHASVADLDGDGRLDVITTSYDANLISIFRNTSSVGSVSFDSRIDIVDGIAPLSTAIRDLDGDGRPDLVIVSSSSVVVFRNLSTIGNIRFAPRVDFLIGINGSYVTTGDIDGDNRPDLVVASLNGYVSVLRNVSILGSITNSSFASASDFTIGNRPYSVAIGDIDGDGKSDLAVASQISNNVSILRNTSISGSVSFDTKVDYAVNVNPYIVVLGDLDGDGKPDMAVSCADSSKLSVLHNTAKSGSITSGSFEPKIDFGNGVNVYTRGVGIGDLDGDGKPELIAANEFMNSVSVFRNVMVGHPKFLATPSALSFGNVDVTTNKKDSLIVKNNGAALLNISSVAVMTGEFSVTPASGSIAISDSMKFYVTFMPSSAGIKLDTVNFVHDATGSPSYVPLSGTGTLPSYLISSSANGPGSITPTPIVSVTHGANQTFAITPNTGAHIDSVLVDDIKVDSLTSYTFNNVTGNHTIASYFSLEKYTITATVGANGAISPLGSITVNHGSNQPFIITANEGYLIDSVIVDGVKVDSINSFTFINVTSNHNIHAVFVANIPVVSTKIYLQGAFGTDSMRTSLRAVLPLTQPYNRTPWNYSGSENVGTIPNNVVDWVLVELRTGTGSGTKVATRAAFVTANGSVVDTNGISPVSFPGKPDGNYYVVILHRNHLAVMSASALALNASSSLFDFTTGLAQYYGGHAKTLGAGKYGLFAGDVNKSNIITNSDISPIISLINATGYNDGDSNMSGIVTNADISIIIGNINRFTDVP